MHGLTPLGILWGWGQGQGQQLLCIAFAALQEEASSLELCCRLPAGAATGCCVLQRKRAEPVPCSL